MHAYLIIESLALLLMVVSTIFKVPEYTLNFFRLVPIATNFIFALKLKLKGPFVLALFLSLLADIFFLCTDFLGIGVALYIGVHLTYRHILKKKTKAIAIVLYLINLLLVVLFESRMKTVEAIVYALLFLSNVILVTRKSKLDKSVTMFTKGLYLLAACDISIVLKLFTKNDLFYGAIDVIEWTAYLLSQLAIVLYAKDETY